MTDSLTPFEGSPSQCYAAGYKDSKRFITMYRAYLSGALDAARDEDRDELILRLCMMSLIFAAWVLMMFFVFKS